MGFQQGLSGLNGAAKSLDVIGNNVANASTVGFKEAQAQFADMYANSMNRSGNSPVGIGVMVANVAQAFTQGNISTTNNPLDIAINGDGFFQLASSPDSKAPMYGRNGQFELDKNGYIINPSMNGAYLMGYAAGVSGGDPVALKIDTSAMPATATTKVSTKVNLDSRQSVPTVTPFDPAQPNSYNNSTGVTMYDSLGNPYSVQTYYVKNATTGTPPTTTWDIYATIDGTTVTNGATPPAPLAIGTMTFDSTGAMTATTGMTLDMTNYTKAGGTFPGTIALSYTGSTQTGSAFVNLAQSQDGMMPGTLSSFSIAKDGSIIGSYSNQQTKTLGQVVLVNFANPNGLQPIGNNLYQATAEAGSPLVGTPTSGSFGTLQSRAVEDSNVDLTAELVNMIVAQRVYQANSQTIKVQDTVLQTLVSMR
ncbi:MULTISPECIES: flagellar hook protein FlgE [unclassified Herbaspirillum]|uniref:flagellar hook protein FlgE n=1 Tax=unclassified Herbaspirillum TaxID=2624150 RepID=UPI001154D158|nr:MULTISPECIES: flagellar hook protein FlgE [unclassified Herbaspirillum]MBB5392910.1 flagellar hook protein FlgE [Herbaspirillum sp. SJZ102]TQK04444.1 flagellar hook protein FlgE [Herbaspirillum sp. SJZ130]TQK09771.1 flagellar hook protein FlgE [Herbaspirillum sp. SJZ106]TWC65879.1 flagellar hook protein FlgE [Herbaspirillum sp. SJZ099]